ncbi:MAG: dihydroneopterin aldolase [Chloroflexota bacterium]
MTDAIELQGIQCFGHHGVLAEERRLGQAFVVDVSLHLDLRPSATADDLTQGVDYASVIRMVREMVEGEPSNLIESVAENIAQALLREFPLVHDLDVCVHKPNAPIGGPPVGDIAARISRARLD